MGMNAGELFLVIFLVVIIFGIGYLGDMGEAIGRMRRRALSPSGKALDVTPPPSASAPARRVAGAITPEDIAGPMEEAELVEGGEERKKSS